MQIEIVGQTKDKIMNILELLIIAIALSMDAFAVAICKGLSIKKTSFKDAVIVGLYFGLFQAGMPLLGYLLGVQFQEKIQAFDHWIALILLVFIGFNMVKESQNNTGKSDPSLNFKSMIILAVATSIDALAVGVTFGFLDVPILPAIIQIGVVTFILSFIGVKIGNLFGAKYKGKAEFVGGLILILMGIRIFLSHTNIITYLEHVILK